MLFHTWKSLYILFYIPRIPIIDFSILLFLDYHIQVYSLAQEDMKYILVMNHSNNISLLKLSDFLEADLKVFFFLFSQLYWVIFDTKWKKGNTCTSCECKLVKPLWNTHKQQYGGSSKNETITIIWITNPTLGYISKGNEIKISERYLHSHVHCSISHNRQDTEITYSLFFKSFGRTIFWGNLFCENDLFMQDLWYKLQLIQNLLSISRHIIRHLC